MKRTKRKVCIFGFFQISQQKWIQNLFTSLKAKNHSMLFGFSGFENELIKRLSSSYLQVTHKLARWQTFKSTNAQSAFRLFSKVVSS